MIYVKPSDVMERFVKYLKDYGDMISKESAIEELKDALEDVDYEEIDE